MCELSQRKIECPTAQPAKQPAGPCVADQRCARYGGQREFCAQYSSHALIGHHQPQGLQARRLLLRQTPPNTQGQAKEGRAAACPTRLHHQQAERSFLPGMAHRDRRRRPESQSRHQERLAPCKMDARNIGYDRTAGAGRSAAPRTVRTRPSSPAGETSSTKRNHIRKWQRD